MRRKIEVMHDGYADVEAAPAPAPDAEAPEFADRVNPPAPEGYETLGGDPLDPAAPPAPRGASQGAEDYITALQAELEEAKRQAGDADKRALYAQADFQNYKRRREEQERETSRFANAELVKGLLPIVDNFERALAAAAQFRDYDKLVGGVSGTLKQLQTFLEKAGVTPIEAVGQEFDPRFHEAIGASEDSDAPANTVAEEVQRGYVMHERVLRPSLVKVVQ